MTMPYETACGQQAEGRCSGNRSRKCCSAIMYVLLIGLLAAALGLAVGAMMANSIATVLPAIFAFAAILVVLIVLKIIADHCTRR